MSTHSHTFALVSRRMHQARTVPSLKLPGDIWPAATKCLKEAA
ncbi:hypothetical protein [Streptomyces sp. NPDC058371]